MGQRLIDTNTVIDYFGKLLPRNAVKIIKSQKVQISVITRIELLSWPNSTPAEIKNIKDFITSCLIFNLSEEIILKTIEVRKNFHLKLPDAIIAATDLVHDLTLFSRNLTDFKRVPDLDVVNPHSL